MEREQQLPREGFAHVSQLCKAQDLSLPELSPWPSLPMGWRVPKHHRETRSAPTSG